MGEICWEADFFMWSDMQSWKDAQKFFQLFFTLKLEYIYNLKVWYILR